MKLDWSPLKRSEPYDFRMWKIPYLHQLQSMLIAMASKQASLASATLDTVAAVIEDLDTQRTPCHFKV